MSGMQDLLRSALLAVAAWGAAGYVAFIALYALASVVFLPASVLTMGAGAVFGAGRGFALVWTGAMLGIFASFLIARHGLRGWVERRAAHMPLFAAIDAAVESEGWRVVLLTRLAPLPFAPLNYAYGVTRVRLGEYLLASGVGIVPGTLLFVHVGAAAGEALRTGIGRQRTTAEWAFLVAGLAAAAAAVRLIGRGAKRALAERARGA
ncbi:MAG: TVP38/TMEM64 family protein [Elusimicrobiota bacterium]|nr:TVP38/TMEM64 family protein [Elusimicrobiota bacterium]